MSLETLEKKLQNHEYSNLSTLESDFKRLVQNAKEMNPRTSEAFNDAERIRKAVSNLMVKTNPAYRSGNYSAIPTPLPPSPGPDDADEDEEDAPGEEEDADMADALDADQDDASDDDEDDDDDTKEEDDAEPEPMSRRRRAARPSRAAPAATPKESRSSSAQATETAEDFKNLNFQQAQEKIVSDMLTKKDDG